MNHDGLSHRIVRFIGHLYPLYDNEQHGEVWGARCLQDGTLILPVEENLDEEQGWVNVYWQGNPGNCSEVSGCQVATLAVARYVELQTLGQSAESRANLYAHMAAHYEFKTGDTLVLEPTDPENKSIKLLTQAIKKVGGDAVTTVVLAKFGIL